MNKKQKVTLWVAVGVLALMLLVPPWKYASTTRGGAIGYSPVFLIPRSRYGTYEGKVDIPRLMLPVCVVIIVAAALFVTFGLEKRRPREPTETIEDAEPVDEE